MFLISSILGRRLCTFKCKHLKPFFDLNRSYSEISNELFGMSWISLREQFHEFTVEGEEFTEFTFDFVGKDTFSETKELLMLGMIIIATSITGVTYGTAREADDTWINLTGFSVMASATSST